MQRYPDYTQQRLKLLAERLKDRIYRDVAPVDSIRVSERVDRIPYAAAQQLSYRPARVGQQFGPLWSTFWFRCETNVPQSWDGQRIDLLWQSQSEATLWMEGKSVQGLNHEVSKRYGDDRPDAILSQKAHAGEPLRFEVEMACNRMFGQGYWQPPDPPDATFALIRCDIALFDEEAWQLFFDFSVLQQLVAEEHLEKPWAGLLLSELNRFANLYEPQDRDTWHQGRQILRQLYQNTNASVAHELSAIGHAHIDTAWLWPLAETRRKCERTFSSQVGYMDLYPEFKFACSQAQQYAWIKEHNPDLWRRMLEKVKSGQFIPIGGTWIEPDCNIPSGESLCRQFLHGQKFFREEFGITCREFWNPDVFGYNGQLPQICRLSGVTRFLTQKLSWNRMNKPLHHTFIWEGIDGSELLTHFPPADTYNAVVSISQLRHNVQNFKDHDRSRESLMLFGFGDGGGGPTKSMLETLRRVKDLQGLPRTEIRTPAEFFARLESDYTDPVRLVGELYFEYHRGTYTSQAAIKHSNRKSELLLHDIEFLCTVAHQLSGGRHAYPRQPLDRLWKTVLPNQFHDILPGSSIGQVYEEAAQQYAQVMKEGQGLRDGALAALARSSKSGSGSVTPVNTISFARAEVIGKADGALAFAEAPAYGIGRFVPAPDQVTARQEADRVVLENAHLRATLDRGGNLLSLIEKETGRDAIASLANQLLLYVDEPNAWDAWDIDPQHMETERPCAPAETCQLETVNLPLRAQVIFERKIGSSSRMRQTVRLNAASRRLEFHCDCDWRESHRLLKVAFAVNVRATDATYEMQFGCARRPTHFNTRYDLARYEVPGHRWSDLSEHGFGVALLSESKYGFSTFGNVMRMSLLRSPKHPDPQADMGRHQFAYALMPHQSDWRSGGVVAEAARFNSPLLLAPIETEPHSFASVDDPNLVLDTIKMAEDGDGIILRLYECHGARGRATLRTALPFQSAHFCNILEEDRAVAAIGDGTIDLPYVPFKIMTLRLR